MTDEPDVQPTPEIVIDTERLWAALSAATDATDKLIDFGWAAHESGDGIPSKFGDQVAEVLDELAQRINASRWGR